MRLRKHALGNASIGFWIPSGIQFFNGGDQFVKHIRKLEVFRGDGEICLAVRAHAGAEPDDLPSFLSVSPLFGDQSFVDVRVDTNHPFRPTMERIHNTLPGRVVSKAEHHMVGILGRFIL